MLWEFFLGLLVIKVHFVVFAAEVADQVSDWLQLAPPRIVYEDQRILFLHFCSPDYYLNI